MAHTAISRIVCLVDNTAEPGSQLWGEHGLSFLIDTEAGRLLFDTGQSGTVLMHNLEAIGVDPQTIDALAISHAHYDHTGGLTALLDRMRPGLPLHAHPDLFRERFSRRDIGEKPRSIGLSFAQDALAVWAVLHLSASPQEVFPGVWTTGQIAPRTFPEGRSAHHLIRGPKGWMADPYVDDMSLVLQVDAKVILLCGCCHAGLLNTLAHVERAFGGPILAIAGGTHLANAEAGHLRQVSRALAEMDDLRRIYLGHCSGQAALLALLSALGPQVVHTCPSGTQVDLEVLS